MRQSGLHYIGHLNPFSNPPHDPGSNKAKQNVWGELKQLKPEYQSKGFNEASN